MYKLFLCLRYLRRRYIALVAIIGMALCVFMVLVVVSVFNGFLNMVQSAARGMMGDVIVDVAGGLPRYDHFLEEARTLPEVTGSSPVIYSWGLLRVGPRYTQGVRVVGLRLPEATAVSTFGEGLYPDGLKRQPRFEVPTEEAQQRVERMRAYLQRQQEQLDKEIAELTKLLELRQSVPAQQQDPEEIAAITKSLNEAKRERDVLPNLVAYDPNLPRVILGVDIPGTTSRDPDTGAYDRYLEVGQKVQLGVLPIGRGYSSLTELRQKAFTYIGDSRMGIYGIDNLHVYVDFDVLQKLLDMGAKEAAEGGEGEPALCTQVQIKLGPAYLGASLEVQDGQLVVREVEPNSPAAQAGVQAGDRLAALDGNDVKTVDDVRRVLAPKRPRSALRLAVLRQGQRESRTAHLRDPQESVVAVKAMYARFQARYPDVPGEESVSIQTWKEKQRDYVEPIEKQRTLTAIMFSIISMVAVVLVFAIFYMMVVQRTRDVGVLKSIGGTSLGVAGIYLLYGCAIGLVGSAAGAIGGSLFIRYINPIHDWVARTFGYRLFDRRAYLFDSIPNQVEPSVVATIIIGAILAGLAGSVLPAMRAARMQPVEALRYE